MSESETIVSQSEVIVSQSEAIVPQSEAIVSESEAIVSESEAIVSESEVIVAESEVIVAQSEVIVSESEVIVSESEARSRRLKFHRFVTAPAQADSLPRQHEHGRCFGKAAREQALPNSDAREVVEGNQEPETEQAPLKWTFPAYRYDQLNRLKEMNAYYNTKLDSQEKNNWADGLVTSEHLNNYLTHPKTHLHFPFQQFIYINPSFAP